MTFLTIGMFLSLGILMAMTPHMARKNIVFGVSFPEEVAQGEQFRKLRKRYGLYALTLSIIASIPALFLEIETALGIYLSIGMMVYIAVMYGLYYAYHRKVKKEKVEINVQVEERIVVATDFHEQKTTVSTGWFLLGNLVLIMVTVLLPVLFYDQIPEQVPTSWSMSEVRGFSNKSFHLFLFPPLVQLTMAILMVVVNRSIQLAKQNISPKRKRESMMGNQVFRKVMSIYTLLLSILLAIILLVTQWMMVFAVENPKPILVSTIVFLILSLGGIIYIAGKYGQGGSRHETSQREETFEKEEAYDDDQFWIAGGMIYYNPNDPTIWLEKRVGLGMTLNFARWQSWAVLLGILAIPVVIILLSTFLQ